MKFDIRYTPEFIAYPEKIACVPIQFSIPLYQRLFAWGETQVEKLLDDLYEHYKSSKEESLLKNTPYYLGQMTIVPKDGCFSLIDGQQRFTVMFLLAIILKKYAPCWEDFFYVNGVMRLSFSGRSEDQQYILHKMKGDNGDVNYCNAKMEQAFSCMQRFMDQMAISEREAFAKHIFCHMSFFFSELPSSYLQNPSSLNQYFEAMNSTGKGLESHDILKVELMRGQENQEYLTRIWNLVSRMEYPLIGSSKEDESMEKCREQYIQAIQSCINGDFVSALNLCISDKEDHSDNSHHQVIAEIEAKSLAPQTYRDSTESSVLSFPDFLLLVLDLTNGPEVRSTSDSDFYKRDKLLSRFHDYMPSDIKMFYNNLLMYRLMLDFYIDRVEYVQGAGHHYLLFKDNEGESYSSLRQYEAMLHVSTNDFYKWVKPFLIYIKEVGIQISSSLLLYKLKDIDNQNHPFVEDINSLSYGVVDRYWFWRLDYYLWERRSTVFKNFNEVNSKAIFNYEFRANRSIEHLHPQNESQNKAWDESKYGLDGFGNLAMISQSFNSTQSNDPVEVKFARIKDQAATSNLQSLKLYHMYLSAGQTIDGWTEEKAKASGEYMFGILVDSYKSSNSEVK